jgi:Pyridoxamine 5'-phosphate oxidase
MKWSEIAASEPALGAIVRERLIGPGVLLVGTTRRDGSARISGVEPLVMDDELWLSMMPASAKARDLARDPRILLHSVVAGPEPAVEIKVRGTARAVADDQVQRSYAAAVAAQLGWRPVVGEFALFAIDIGDVTYIGYDPDTSGQHVARWPAGLEYIRPSVTPTSLGPPQPVQRLLHAP